VRQDWSHGRCGKIGVMAGTAAGRRGASVPTSTWDGWLVRDLTADAGACVCSEAQAWELWRVRDVHGGWTQSGSVARLEWPASARGRACVHKKGRASSSTTRHSLCQAEGHHGRRCLGSPQRNAGKLGSGEDTERKRVGVSPFPSNVCAGARACRRVRRCVQKGARGTHRRQDRGGSLNGGAAWRPDERTESTKERTASGLRARRSTQWHLQGTASQPGSKAGITQRDGAEATRQGTLG
jgi:hypothetical protein